jgi:hypothetical protein
MQPKYFGNTDPYLVLIGFEAIISCLSLPIGQRKRVALLLMWGVARSPISSYFANLRLYI